MGCIIANNNGKQLEDLVLDSNLIGANDHLIIANEQLVNEIKKAMNSHIPKNNKNDKKSNPLLSYLVDLIKQKKKLENKIKHNQIHDQTTRRDNQ